MPKAFTSASAAWLAARLVARRPPTRSPSCGSTQPRPEVVRLAPPRMEHSSKRDCASERTHSGPFCRPLDGLCSNRLTPRGAWKKSRLREWLRRSDG